jgi:hypothetical protein
MPATSRAFGGAAFARYDRTEDGALRDDLLAVATQLIEHQNPDGSVRNDDTRFPVVQGPLQATTQALQTWHQAYSRSADERWLGPDARGRGVAPVARPARSPTSPTRAPSTSTTP